MVCLVLYVSSITYDVVVSVLMTDPAIAYLPNQGYEPYDRGTQLDLWLKTPNGGPSLGVVWPGMFYPFWRRKNTLPIYTGVTVFPGKNVLQHTEIRIHCFNSTRLDWFHPSISE